MIEEDKRVANKKEKQSAFDHLKKVASVGGKKEGKNIIGLAIGSVVLVLIVILMFSGGHSPTVIKQKVDTKGPTDDLAIEQNIHKLQKLENGIGVHKTPQMVKPHFSPLSGLLPTEQNRKLEARRSAPTLMYSVNASSQSGMQRASSENNKTNVLAGQGRFAQFANGQASQSVEVQGSKILHPYFTVASGEMIHATLETAINSDLPGQVRALVSEPVYAYEGEQAVIPAGSRLIGQYASLSSNGSASTRVFVIWNRVITPNGISMMINSTSTDALGEGGVGADSVDHHFFKIFGTATLLSVMGASTQMAGVSSTQQPNSADQYRQAIGSAFQQSAQNTLQQNMSIKPTIHVHQGDAINVFVAKDLDFYSVLHQGSNEGGSV